MSTEKNITPEEECEKLQQKSILEKYSAVIHDRWQPYHDELAEAMYRRAGASNATIDKIHNAGLEAARAFFIHLVITKFGFSQISDILLMDMSLLEGYQFESGVMDRRKKYFIESDYRVYDNPDGKSYKDTSADALDKRAADLNKKDAPWFKQMMVFFDGIDDKEAFFETACSRYLEVPKNSNGAVKVRYPVPHYKIRFENPIKHLPITENEDFCGREDVLRELDEGFKSRYERNIQILYGMGGVGKTEIALKYAYEHLNEYSTIVWLDATSISILENDALRFLSAYSSKGIDGVSDTESAGTAFCRFMNQRVNSLIILDNADYLDKNTETGEREIKRLSWFIPKKNAHTIITTRCNTDVRGTKRIAVEAFKPETAALFLQKKARREADSYAEKLAQLVGFLPLALEYAGAYIATQDISYEEYIEKWERGGTQIFDMEYATTTVRRAFRITLDKIQTPFAIEFLQYFSELGVNEFPIQAYLDAVEELIQRTRDKLSQPNCELYLEQISKDGVKLFKILNVLEDGSFEVAETTGPNSHFTIPQDPFLRALKDELSRDEIIRVLKEYSLIHWSNGIAWMHPLLQEVVLDEQYRANKAPLVGQAPNELLLKAFKQCGSEEAAKDELGKIICNGIKHIEDEIVKLPKYAELSKKNGSKLHNYYEDLLFVDALVEKAEEHGDKDLINKCKELRNTLVDMKDDLGDVIEFDPSDSFRLVLLNGDNTIIPYTGQ